jgi:hypothetical protein
MPEQLSKKKRIIYRAVEANGAPREGLTIGGCTN